MPWNKIALIGSTEKIHLTLLELPFNQSVGVNGVWWWNQNRYTALASSETTDYIWVHTGAHVSIGAWQGNPRYITWFMQLWYARRAANGELSVLYSDPALGKGKGKVTFPGARFPGITQFDSKEIDTVTWASADFKPGIVKMPQRPTPN